jgi:hypothetical protein
MEESTGEQRRRKRPFFSLEAAKKEENTTTITTLARQDKEDAGGRKMLKRLRFAHQLEGDVAKLSIIVVEAKPVKSLGFLLLSSQQSQFRRRKRALMRECTNLASS